MALLQVLPEEPVLCYGCTAGVTAAPWYLAAGGSLSMLPDTSNWGLQYHVTLDVQMAWSYCYFAVMVARISHPYACPAGLSTALLRYAATSGKSWPTVQLGAPQNFLPPLYSSPLHPVTWFLPAPWGARCTFCKHICRSTSPASLRHGFCGGGKVAFPLFASTPPAVFALVQFS